MKTFYAYTTPSLLFYFQVFDYCIAFLLLLFLVCLAYFFYLISREVRDFMQKQNTSLKKPTNNKTGWSLQELLEPYLLGSYSFVLVIIVIILFLAIFFTYFELVYEYFEVCFRYIPWKFKDTRLMSGHFLPIAAIAVTFGFGIVVGASIVILLLIPFYFLLFHFLPRDLQEIFLISFVVFVVNFACLAFMALLYMNPQPIYFSICRILTYIHFGNLLIFLPVHLFIYLIDVIKEKNLKSSKVA